MASGPGTSPGRGRPYYRLADLRLRGLLHLLGDDTRLATFVERELGPLIAHDQAHGTGLTKVLGAYLAEGGNKAAAAGRAHLARPTFYERLRLIERILGVSLDSAESRTSLHVALLAFLSVTAWRAGPHPAGGRPPADLIHAADTAKAQPRPHRPAS